MKGAMPIWGWVLIGVALAVSFAVDFNNTAQGGAIDLRNRITGLRLLEHGIDAYHYKWHNGDPEEYCDVYNNPKLAVSKTTATPTLLMLHLPLAALPYRPAQFLWLFAQWALLLGTGWLWLRVCKTPWQSWIVALAVTGFTYTAAWRLHARNADKHVRAAGVSLRGVADGDAGPEMGKLFRGGLPGRISHGAAAAVFAAGSVPGPASARTTGGGGGGDFCWESGCRC